ncbi:hypothetical protein GCM10008967_00400 [Bacillus carboniphilus]|uniref:Fibronectin type-III domain-containing protein n=1 Tax=Bacillus carboniphilus TaxID=86663 RepID=A0ABN0VP83_9BACI
MPTQNFKVGEMINKRSPNSKTWINFDGSYTTEIHSGLVHYEDENGNLQNINTDLYDEADLDSFHDPVNKHATGRFKEAREKARAAKASNSLNRDLFDYQGLKVPFEAKLPRNFKRGYTIGKGQDRLSFIPVGASPAKGYVDNDKKNVIDYQDAWNDADVNLELTDRGIKETIILKTDRAPSKFSFEVKGPLKDDLTAGELRLMNAWLKDAAGTERDVDQLVRRENGKVYVDLVADVSGLSYPIEIDPTVTIQPVNGKDTYVYSGWPDNNYGTEQYLRVGTNGDNNYYSFVEFDFSSIPSGADVTDALFSLCLSNAYNTIARSVTVQEALASWDETTLTARAFPGGNTSNEVSILVTGTPDVYESWQVKDMVDRWIKNVIPNYGFRIIGENGGGTSTYKYFYSSEYAGKEPKISVTYNVPPTAPTVITPNGGETWNSLHTVEWVESIDNDASEQTVGVTNQANNQSMTVRTGSGYVNKVSQPFKTPNGASCNLKKVYLELSTPSSGTTISFDIGIYNVDSNLLPTTVIYESNHSYFTTGTYEIVEFEFGPVQLNADTNYAIVVTAKTTYSTTLYGSSTVTLVDRMSIFRNNTWEKQTTDFQVQMVMDVSSSDGIQYQIQLTTDDGANWKDIVALTTAGATTYDYDFINEPQSSLCKIRIRAYDGTSYGEWDYSDGVFTIQHNQAPTAPTNLSPTTTQDRAKQTRYSWQHNDPDNDAQSKFDFQWRLQGASTWNTITQVTSNQYYDMPAGTLPRGTIEWRVRTYDQADLSGPYSTIAVFFAGDKPSNPTITNPTNGATVSIANPTVQWSSSGQTDYHLKVLDSGNTLVWESIKNSTNKAETVQFDLQNGASYKVQLASRNADGIWSDFVSVDVNVSYTPPAVPVVTPTVDNSKGAIVLTIDNPVPSGTEPNVSYNSIFRKKQGETEFKRIATNIPTDGTFIDYTPASDQIYEYKVRTWGDNGTYSESVVVSQSIKLTGVWLHDVTDPEGIHNFKLDGGGRSKDWSTDAAYMKFAGRPDPVTEFSEHEDDVVNATIKIMRESGEHIILERLLKSRNILCYRDGRGRRLFGTATQFPLTDESWGYATEIKVRRTSYSEVV